MRAIDADALIKWLDNYYDSEKFTVGYICNMVKDMPTIEPERKTGKWIYGEHDVAMCDGYRCNKCGFFVPWDYKHKSIDYIKDYHFCPNCGTDMRSEQNE